MDGSSPPPALRPFYSTKYRDEPVLLYDGAIEVLTPEWRSSNIGRIHQHWQPEASIHLDCAHDPPMTGNPSVQIRLSEESAVFDATLYSMGLSVEATKTSATLKGFPAQMYSGEADNFISITFHIPNFLAFKGSSVTDVDADEIREARATIDTDNWLITIDTIGKYDILDQKKLEDFSGNALTHVGRITRKDGSPFSLAEGKDLLEIIYRWLSFCRGNWTAPILAIGSDSDTDAKWKDWRQWNIRRSENVGTWSNRTTAEFAEKSFAGLYRRYSDSAWQESIRLSVAWYVECNRRASGMEAAIILSQTGLELLGWTYLVENLKVISSGGFDHLPASDKIRLLLTKCDIPLEIPDELRSLKSFAKQRSWNDGPESLVGIRNAVIHPQAKNRAKLSATPSTCVYEVWNLGVWYLELVLLRLFDYSAVYHNRLKRHCTYDESLEKVPWA